MTRFGYGLGRDSGGRQGAAGDGDGPHPASEPRPEAVAELDEEYIRRREDVLALYEKPLSEEEPVVCIDEKPVVLHQDMRAPRPARPGQIARRDYEYKRRGTANDFCGVEPKAGWHFPKATPTRAAAEAVSSAYQGKSTGSKSSALNPSSSMRRASFFVVK